MLSIRPMAEADAHAPFSCGHEALDRYFQRFAWPNQAVYSISRTYVATDATRILGFVTVASSEIASDDVPRRRAGAPRYPFPVLRLARLGVDVSMQRRGVGSALTLHVFRLAIEMEKLLGCAGVLVDAKVESVLFYSALGFIPLPAREGEILEHPTPVPMFLDIGAIRLVVAG